LRHLLRKRNFKFLGSSGEFPLSAAGFFQLLVQNQLAKCLFMNSKSQSIARAYDGNYRCSNFFRHRRWIFRPFIRALAIKTHLVKGSSVLDLGCGQGFFTSLFADLGMKALGVDISGEAIRSASKEYSSSGAKFEIGDVMSLPYDNAFDCVFVRSCSLYNSLDFEENSQVTDVFLGYVKQGGVLVFDYNSKLCPEKSEPTWRDHSFAAAKKHFSCYPHARVFFSIRLEAILFGPIALTLPITRLAVLVNWLTGIGGELVAILRKQ
jgi:SAM-dependent methyltransferase